MILRTFILFIFFLSLILPARSAVDDSAIVSFPIPTSVRFTHAKSQLTGSKQWTIPDSSLQNFEDVNPAIYQQYNYLGNLGSAANPRIFSSDQEILFKAGFRSYDLYLWKPDSLCFYRTNKRFTQIDYHNGTFKEGEIRFLHSQNILKNWNAGLDFHRLGVKDFTRNSDTFHNQIALLSWYESPNTRYNVFVSAIWNAIKNQLNGGLVNDSAFNTGNIDNLGLKGQNIELADAKHQFKNHVFSMHNRYNVLSVRDTVKDDRRKINSFQLIQSTQFESGSYSYTDTEIDSSFYKDFYTSSDTHDSLHFFDLRNSAGLLLPYSDSSPSLYFKNFSTVLEAEHQWFSYTQRDELYWNNYSLKARLFSPLRDTCFGFTGAAQYVFAGANQGMYLIEAKLNSPAYKAGTFYASTMAVRRNADLMYQNYYSNHFIWQNNFESVKSQTVRAGISNGKYKFQLEVSLQSVQNLVYASQDASPMQASGSVEISQIKVIKNFRLGNFHLDNDFYFQHSSQEIILPLATYTGAHAFYFEKFYFKNALLAQVGLNLHFNSAYFADAFMPASSFFYRQEEKKTGGYALMDLFFSIKIKTARIFLKVENIGDGIIGDSYYLTPTYPQAGRTLQFGLSWRFYDM